MTQTENVQAARQIRFTDHQEILALEPVIKDYIYEAIEIEKSGLEVEHKKTTDFEIPGLKAAFTGLTSGRQRAYLLYFSGAKQPKTREPRVNKWIPQILQI